MIYKIKRSSLLQTSYSLENIARLAYLMKYPTPDKFVTSKRVYTNRTTDDNVYFKITLCKHHPMQVYPWQIALNYPDLKSYNINIKPCYWLTVHEKIINIKTYITKLNLF